MVHVSQLKQHLAPTVEVSTDLSSVSVEPLTPVLPLAILDKAYKSTGPATVLKVLVQWDTPSKFTTWEDEADLHCRFPQAPAWGQAVSEGRGSVMTKAAK